MIKINYVKHALLLMLTISVRVGIDKLLEVKMIDPGKIDVNKMTITLLSVGCMHRRDELFISLVLGFPNVVMM